MKKPVEDYISALQEAEEISVPYPLAREEELFRAVVRGDRETAGTLLNQLLGHIYYYAEDNEEIHIRIEELFVVLMPQSPFKKSPPRNSFTARSILRLKLNRTTMQ